MDALWHLSGGFRDPLAHHLPGAVHVSALQEHDGDDRQALDRLRSNGSHEVRRDSYETSRRRTGRALVSRLFAPLPSPPHQGEGMTNAELLKWNRQ